MTDDLSDSLKQLQRALEEDDAAYACSRAFQWNEMVIAAEGKSLLALAIELRALRTVPALVRCGLKPDEHSPSGLTALDLSVTCALHDADCTWVAALLAGGFEPDYSWGDHAATLLMRASLGSASMAEVTLAYGARVDAKDSEGCTALMYACMTDEQFCDQDEAARIVGCLIRAGASLSAQDTLGHSPRAVAERQLSDNSAVLALLKKYNAP